MTTLLHLSDLHLDDDLARGRLDRALRILPPSRRPDLIVITGDLADHGRREEYVDLVSAMRGDIPWIVCPGNHDDPALMAQVLGWDQSGAMSLDVDDVRVVALDVTVPGEDHGHLRPEVTDAAFRAAEDAENVVLALHHPPVPLGHEYADSIGLSNPTALGDLVIALPRTRLVVTGHVHTALATTFAGRPVVGAPSLAAALRPDPAARPLTDAGSAPGVALHELGPDGVRSSFHYAWDAATSAA
ncbi:metallophosphoesterase [Jiangella asiatica]|uniref:metallophosphoesterase n=1 Tax=Jiangella asiatica TaxID=2530372 RepID=UPI0013A5CB7C|nr:metallophosphoesterase [Jiangella asiatica]